MKKHISIIGSCVSRHIFNTRILEDAFEVDRYAYQVCAWDMFGGLIGVGKDKVASCYKEEFTARMVWYDLDKVTAREMELAASEYLMVDLYTIIQTAWEFSRCGSVAYAQTSYDRYSQFLEAIEKHDEWKDISIRRIPYGEVPQDKIEIGLGRFADWVLKHYLPENVIINIPPFAKRYYDITGELHEYSQSLLSEFDKLLRHIKKYSYLLAELIPGSKVLAMCDVDVTSQYGVYDDIRRTVPTEMHYTDEDYVKYSTMLLDLLGLPYSLCVDGRLSAVGYECMRYRNLYLSTRKQVNSSAQRTQVLNVAVTNLNSYVRGIENLNDFIVVIAAKDEAKNLISKFTEHDRLGLDMSLIFRGSYIAIVDNLRGFVYERAEAVSQQYEYSIDDTRIVVQSAGYTSGNASSIKVIKDGVEEELSLNRRGLNIVILNSRTLELVDKFKCDTHLDGSLEVQSIYLARQLAEPHIKV